MNLQFVAGDCCKRSSSHRRDGSFWTEPSPSLARDLRTRRSNKSASPSESWWTMKFKVIVHLGAQTQVRHAEAHPFAALEGNVRGTYNLLEAARRQSAQVVAMVVASSDKAYGENGVLPYTEDHPLAGTGIYDASKSAADLPATAYARTYGLLTGIAGCANICEVAT